ncbi:hypothetical protein LUZ60_000081 [Juncus effusus]|nr:hypothetical protein LUZ60_000081 [Juncus effusus]
MAEMSDSPPSASHDYPTIDPTSFDLIISGTGLPQSLLAAAASSAGKSVLHVDPNPYYGSHFSSLPLPLELNNLYSHLETSGSIPEPSGSFTPVPLELNNLYSRLETSGSIPEPSGRFTIDLTGPRVLYCADELVDLLLKSGASHHVEFKSVDLSLVYWEGKICSVPDSRQAIFKDKSLGLAEKSQMMKFLKVVQTHIESNRNDGSDLNNGKISEMDLDLPFVEFLKKQKLPLKIRAIILYAIIMTDFDQDQTELNNNKLVTTREGIERIYLYTSSMGRFANAVGAFIYPMYGHAELPQAFCRCAAVKGALYVLRMPVSAVLFDKETNNFKGVRLASGQEIYSPKLVLDPSCKIPPSISPCEKTKMPLNYIARGICITSGSVQLGSSNVLLVFPPKCLKEEQLTAVRALQLSSNVAVCPTGLFVVHLSTLCENPILGKEIIKSAINALFINNTNSSENANIQEPTNNETETKPTLLWSAVFIQEIVEQGLESDSVTVCPTPDENLDYRNILNTTKKLFENLYPGEEFQPQNSAKDDNNDEFNDDD